MPMVDIYKAKRRLPGFVDEAAAGKEVIISRNGKPLARLVAIHDKQMRIIGFGALEGKGWIADDFDAPIPNEILVQFEM